MGSTWEYGEDGYQSISFEYRPGGTVDVVAAGYEGFTEITGLPYAEFKALAAVMHEYHLAEEAKNPKLDGAPDAREIREVLAMSGLGPGGLARLMGVGVSTLLLWYAGVGGIRHAEKRKRLERIRGALGRMDFDPHTGRRAALFAPRDGRPSLYDELLRELPRSEPVQ